MRTKRIFKKILYLLVAFVVTSCGGGGGSDPSSSSVTSPVVANGLWEGTATENGVGTFRVVGLVYDGRIIAISEQANVIYDGNYVLSGSTITGTVTIYQINGGPVGTANISGTVSEQRLISARFVTSYGTSGSLSLKFDSIYNRPSSIALVEGTWRFSESGYNVAITVQSDGTFFGQDSFGCVVTGKISIINSSKNIYDVKVTISSCGVSNGVYTGYAGLFDNVMQNDTLQLAVSNDNFIILFPFYR